MAAKWTPGETNLMFGPPTRDPIDMTEDERIAAEARSIGMPDPLYPGAARLVTMSAAALEGHQAYLREMDRRERVLHEMESRKQLLLDQLSHLEAQRIDQATEDGTLGKVPDKPKKSDIPKPPPMGSMLEMD